MSAVLHSVEMGDLSWVGDALIVLVPMLLIVAAFHFWANQGGDE